MATMMKSDRIKWRRNEEIEIFRKVLDEKGFLSTHRIGWTGTIRLNNLKDQAAQAILGDVQCRWPRISMRWRKDKETNQIYLRLVLNLDQARVQLPGWPGTWVYFAYGMSKADPIDSFPVSTGLRHYYHGSPHIVVEQFNHKPHPQAGITHIRRREVARTDNEKYFFSTYFWVDFTDPDEWTIDNVRSSVDAMLELAAQHTASMKKAVQPGQPLYAAIEKSLPAGICRCVKKANSDDDTTIESLRVAYRNDPEIVTKGLHRAARWALRKEDDKKLRWIHKLGVDFDSRTRKKNGSIIHAIIAIKVARELGS